MLSGVDWSPKLQATQTEKLEIAMVWQKNGGAGTVTVNGTQITKGGSQTSRLDISKGLHMFLAGAGDFQQHRIRNVSIDLVLTDPVPKVWPRPVKPTFTRDDCKARMDRWWRKTKPTWSVPNTWVTPSWIDNHLSRSVFHSEDWWRKDGGEFGRNRRGCSQRRTTGGRDNNTALS